MKRQPHLLSSLWESYPITEQYEVQKNIPIGQYLAEMLTIGPFYYYVINIADYSLYQIHENLLHILGMTSYPTTVKQIIDCIHPDDLEFVFEAEKATLIKMDEMGLGKGTLYRTSYCFRMKVAAGQYHLFHHQGIHLNCDHEKKITAALNIHTDINHITCTNNKIVLVKPVGGAEYSQIDLSLNGVQDLQGKISKREMEVLHLLAKGLSSTQIADRLFISPLTVRVHRRNLLKKTKTSNSGSLIKKSIESGLI